MSQRRHSRHWAGQAGGQQREHLKPRSMAIRHHLCWGHKRAEGAPFTGLPQFCCCCLASSTKKTPELALCRDPALAVAAFQPQSVGTDLEAGRLQGMAPLECWGSRHHLGRSRALTAQPLLSGSCSPPQSLPLPVAPQKSGLKAYSSTSPFKTKVVSHELTPALEYLQRFSEAVG